MKTLKNRAAYLAISTALVTAIPVAGSTQTSGSAEPPAADITVTNSPNAVTGQTVNIGTIVYQEARKDPITRKLVATLRSYSKMMMDRTEQAEGEQGGYIFALDDGGAAAGSTGDLYFIIVADAEDEELGERVARCDVEDNASAFGFVARASADGPDTRWKMRMMTREYEPLLQSVCRGLRLPVAALISDGAQGRSDATIFEYLSHGSGVLVFSLMSARMMGQDLETSIFSSYWKSALALRYRRPPTQASVVTPEMYDQVNGLAGGEWIEGKMPGILPGSLNPESYPPQARHEFGARLDRLDADWMDYLKGVAVTIRGQQRAVVQNDQLSRVLPRFKLSEVGTVQFWRSAADLTTAIQQTNCLAQQFLVDKEYVAPEDAPFVERCGLDDIRLPAS